MEELHGGTSFQQNLPSVPENADQYISSNTLVVPPESAHYIPGNPLYVHVFPESGQSGTLP